MAEPSSSPANDWQRQARRVAFRVNTALLLEKLLPWLAALALAAAATTVLVRTMDGMLWPVLAAVALASIGLFCWQMRKQRGRFWSANDGLVRLEIANQLEGRLSTAKAGVAGWPNNRRAEDAYRSRWFRAAGPLFAGLAIWALAAWLPLPQDQTLTTPVAQPLAITQAEELLETLEEVEELEPESLNKFEEALDQLKSRPAEDWYSHSSLEAGESLLANMQDSARRLADSLAGADSALGQAGQPSTSTEGQAERAASDLREALNGMNASELRLGSGLEQALQNAGTPSGLRQLSLSQLQRLRMRINQVGTGVGNGLGQPFGEGSGEGEQGDGPGRGEVQRGPGTAPLTIGERNPLETEGVDGGLQSDLEGDVGIGDVVGTRLTAPEENEQPFSLSQGGDASISAAAEAVNRQPVTPVERRLLQRYFQ